jgi:hypothetical protein
MKFFKIIFYCLFIIVIKKKQELGCISIGDKHRHVRNVDCLKVHASLVCFISTVNGHHKKEKKKEALKDWR